MRLHDTRRASLPVSILLTAVLPLALAHAAADDWGSYGHDPGGTRYSPLTQITPANVSHLKPVWVFHTGDTSEGSNHGAKSGFESTPLFVDGRLFLTSSFNRIIALDAASGRQLWSYDPQVKRQLPYGDGLTNRGVAAWRDPLTRPAGAPPGAWRTGAGNAWSILSADPRRHRVYVPTGSASPDYYGGLRPGDDRWADSVVALDSRSGRFVWGFQLVHHDLWDYDTAAAPLLTTVTFNGRRTSVLIAGNKTGMLYVLDPSTGRPVLPIEERAVPASTLPGEATSPTQPFPTSIPPLARTSLMAGEGWGLTAADRDACNAILKGLSGRSMFTPPSTQGSLAVPGNIGGINWSGFAWDAQHERLIVALSDLPYRVQMIPAAQFAGGARADFRGDAASQRGAPYALQRAPLVGPSGLPCTPPPWGEIVAVNLASGQIAWRQPVGSMEEVFGSRVRGIAGSVLLGGPIVTASGLIFTGGTMDHRFHALSAATGEELWSASLPASAQALPMTYRYHGRQYVVIAAGGDAEIREEARGDALVAFALPSAR